MAATGGGGTSQQQQQTWVPFESAKDCSQGFCSIYCPQWCYIIFPPPPPFAFPAADDDDGDSSSGPTAFSPLVIAIIGILASAFLLVSYYLILSKYCRRRRSRPRSRRETDQQDSAAGVDAAHETTWHVSSSSNGLDETLIGKISVYKYRRGEGVVDGTDCSVCLGEFREEESLRLLPKCGHAFHLQCIDTWLRSHSNCPLCRANIVSTATSSEARASSNPEANRQRNDHEIAVLVVAEEGADGAGGRQATASSESTADGAQNIHEDDASSERSRDDRKEQLRRSFSVDYDSSQSQRTRVSVADVLQGSDDEEIAAAGTGSGSSTSNSKTSVSIKRSLSSGRFGLARQGKGRNSLLPL